jgi:hypothetical protein
MIRLMDACVPFAEPVRRNLRAKHDSFGEQTRHRAKQIEEEKQGKPRATEDSLVVASFFFVVTFLSVTLI